MLSKLWTICLPLLLKFEATEQKSENFPEEKLRRTFSVVNLSSAKR